MSKGKKQSKFKPSTIKLWLYIATAALATLLADLQHISDQCQLPGHDFHLKPVFYISSVVNFVLQGLIAWRAFLDNSIEHEKRRANESQISEDYTEPRR
jgi:hypothetical protein